MTDNQVDHPAVITHTSRHTQREIMVPSAVRVVSEQARHESPQRRVSATASMSDKRIVTSVKIRLRGRAKALNLSTEIHVLPATW